MNHHPQPGPNKFDLVGQKVLIHVVDANAAHIAHYGVTHAAWVSIYVLEGDHSGWHNFDARPRAFFGNAARSIIRELPVNGYGVGIVTTGITSEGREWFGVDWVEDPRVIDDAMLRASNQIRAERDIAWAPGSRRFAAVGSRVVINRAYDFVQLDQPEPERDRWERITRNGVVFDRISSRSDAVVDKYNLTPWEIGLTVEGLQDDPELLKA